MSNVRVPDGGWGWVIIAAGFCSHLLNTGFVQTIGVYMVAWQDYFSEGAGTVAIITSVFSFISHLVAMPSGALCRRYGCRRVQLLSGLIAVVSMFLASFATKLYHLHIFAVFSGIGFGMAFPPPIVLTSLYFRKRLGLANGILYTGIGIGVLAMAPLVAILCSEYGWQGALLIQSAITANKIVCGAMFRPSNLEKSLLASRRREGARIDNSVEKFLQNDKEDHPRRRRCFRGGLRYLDNFFGITNLLKNRRFSIFLLSTTFVFLGQASCVIYTPPKLVFDLEMSKLQASLALTVMGICNTLSSLLHGPALDRRVITATNLFILSVVLMGASALLNPLIDGYAGQMVLAGLLGTGQGIVFPMLNVVCLELVGITNLPVAIGLVIGLGGVGALVGIQLMGVLYDATGSFELPFFIAGGAQCLAIFIIILLTRCVRTRDRNSRTSEESTNEITQKMNVLVQTKKSDITTDRDSGGGFVEGERML